MNQASNIPAIDKGAERYNRYRRMHIEHFGKPPRGRLLDFGCGAGGFLIAATRAGLDAFGCEVDEDRRDQFEELSRVAPEVRGRFHLYDGTLLPFASNTFDCCYSWFVFEHVQQPQVSLREIMRVLRPGGTLVLQAEDVRNGWDGHVRRPWPPYMPRQFAPAYLDELGISGQDEFLVKYVTYISAPVVVDILRTLGAKIFYRSGRPAAPAVEGLYVTSEEEARALGRKVREMQFGAGPEENLTVVVRKRPRPARSETKGKKNRRKNAKRSKRDV